MNNSRTKVREDRANIMNSQIRKYCTSKIAMLDAEINFGDLTKEERAKAWGIISGLYHILKTQKLIDKIAEQCTIQPRIVTIKFRDGRHRRRVHRYVAGIPEAIRTLGIF